MIFDSLINNLTNPALLFFFLGLFSVWVKSDLEIPASSSKFISLYLLFSIGFRGGQELSHSILGVEIVWSLLFGIALALIMPVFAFFLLRKNVGVANAAAIAATYGSVSAVTFVTAISYLQINEIQFDGHMVAVMAIMEAPSIVMGLVFFKIFNKEKSNQSSFSVAIKHSITNGSVLLIMGSLVIGLLVSDAQAEGISPFTTDLFKGFLAVFLLDMGISSGKKLSSFLKNGPIPLLFAIAIPIISGSLVAILSRFITDSQGNQFLFAILAASASYIAVPAAMRIAIPQANSGLYLTMALGVTFPFNITLGIPLYMYIVQSNFF